MKVYLINFYLFVYLFIFLEMMLDNLFPIIKRCLGKDENYDLRMDSAVVSCVATYPLHPHNPFHFTYNE